jgi:hypothetical protein
MGTQVQKRAWSWVQDRTCGCGACERRQKEIRARRAAIIRAQELNFDEPHRMTGLENPLAADLDLTEVAAAS